MGTSCKCALDGDNGYCGSILGTSEYQDALLAIKLMLQGSNCHTLDRFDYRAQRELCGIGKGALWSDAVEQKFNISYWPYVNAEGGVKDCVEKTFFDSLSNLSKDGAIETIALTATATASALMLALL